MKYIHSHLHIYKNIYTHIQKSLPSRNKNAFKNLHTLMLWNYFSNLKILHPMSWGYGMSVFYRANFLFLSLCKSKQQCRGKSGNWQELIGFPSIPLITCKRYCVWWMLWILNVWFPVCLSILTPCNLMEVKTSRIQSESY